jgi:hypothetical protein
VDRWGYCDLATMPSGRTCVEVPPAATVVPWPTCTVGVPVEGRRTCVIPGERDQSSGEVETK